MSYKAYLSQTICQQSCQSSKYRTFARFIVLAFSICLLWFITTWQSVFAATPPTTSIVESSCHSTIKSIQVAKATGSDGIQRPDTGWQSVHLPDHWDSRWRGYTGSVWYKIIWMYDCPKQTRDPVTLVIDRINMAGQIYLNDELLWQDKSLVEPLSRSWNMPRYWNIPASSLQQGKNIFWIRVVGVMAQDSMLGTVILDQPQIAMQKYQRYWNEQRVLVFFNLCFSFTLSLMAFLVWIFHRQEKAFGWFALTSFFWTLFMINVAMIEAPFGLTTLQIARINIVVFCAYSICHCLYSWRFAHRKFPRLEKILYFFVVMVTNAAIIVPDHHIEIFLTVSFLLACFIIILQCICFPFLAYHIKETESYLLAVVFIFYLLVAIHDFYTLFLGISDFFLTPYSTVFTLLSITIILALRLSKNFKQIDQFNQTLENNIQNVKQELSTSLNTQHQLELDNTRLQERINLSHDLHDGLGGSLVRAMTMINQNHQQLNNQQFLSILKHLRDDLRQVVDTGSSTGAKVPETPILWGAPVRHRFIQIFDELGIKSSWSFPQQWQTQPTALECLTLLRVAEEALTNIIKHSQAKQVQIRLLFPEPQQLLLEIEDDGIGFDVEAVRLSGISVGIRSMQIRLEKVQAKMVIESNPGRTCIRVVKIFGKINS